MTKKTRNKVWLFHCLVVCWIGRETQGLFLEYPKHLGFFSRIISDFGVNICANPNEGVKFLNKSTQKSLFKSVILAWRNPHLGGALTFLYLTVIPLPPDCCQSLKRQIQLWLEYSTIVEHGHYTICSKCCWLVWCHSYYFKGTISDPKFVTSFFFPNPQIFLHI